MKYTLLQLPGIAILVSLLMLARQLVDIPPWLMWSFIGIWVAKDVVFYPLVWRSYDWGYQEENNPMIGLRGIAKDRLDPSGYIIVRGELWKAKVIKAGLAIERGENVLVQGIRRLTLLVEPENKEKGIKNEMDDR